MEKQTPDNSSAIEDGNQQSMQSVSLDETTPNPLPSESTQPGVTTKDKKRKGCIKGCLVSIGCLIGFLFLLFCLAKIIDNNRLWCDIFPFLWSEDACEIYKLGK